MRSTSTLWTLLALATLAGCDSNNPPAGTDAGTADSGTTPDGGGGDVDGGGPGVDSGMMMGEFCGIAGGCDVLAQTACMGGEACYYTNSMDMSRTGCFSAGAGAIGATCTNVNDCGVGLTCGGGECATYCCSSTDCTGGAICTALTDDPMNGLGYCRTPDTCDPVAATGCPDGSACYFDLELGDGTAFCEPAGSRATGETCGGAEGLCLPGNGCLRAEGAAAATCYRWCRTDAMPSTCGDGMGCARLTMTGVAGVCVPAM